MVLIVIAVVSVLVGAFSGRWWSLVVPLLLVGGFYTDLSQGWWGDGLGDFGVSLGAIIASTFMIGTAVAVAVARGAVSFRR